jgi:outer membrane scaffolding protein for murein synthesis (MipA/OmpV family)
MRRTTVLLGAAALSLMAAGAAEARGWVVSPGAKVNVLTPYEGADHFITRPSPTFSIRPASRPYRFTPSDGGTTFELIDTEHFTFGPMARFRFKRDNTGELTGLRKVKWAAEPGAFIDYWPVHWLRTRAEVRQGVTGHKGLVADLGADLVMNRGRWSASIGPRVGFGNRKYMDTYFGVTAAEALANPSINRTYAPDGGLRYKGVTVAGAYYLNRNWRLRFDAGYKQLTSIPSDSPVVQDVGSRDQWSGSFGISRSFSLGL